MNFVRGRQPFRRGRCEMQWGECDLRRAIGRRGYDDARKSAFPRLRPANPASALGSAFAVGEGKVENSILADGRRQSVNRY